MPELPEVETVKRTVFEKIAHHTILKVEVRNDDVLENYSSGEFSDFLTGNAVVDMDRRGKYLIFHMNHGGDMVLHLRMTGQLVAFENMPTLDKHCHVVIYFEHGGMYYRDVRRFGRFWIVKDGETCHTGMETLGPEPFSESFCADYLYQSFQHHKCAVKCGLLDQRIVAGIGNIYADEILFDAKINPFRPCNTLSLEECRAICGSTVAVLSLAIEKRGTTFSDYRDGYGVKGNFQNYLKIFQRGGEPCPCCGAVVKKATCGGRGTSYCPECQKYERCKRVIGLTGGIASGKSFVSSYLKTLGAEIIDADEIAREIMEPHGKIPQKINETFGGGFLDEKGNLHRKRLKEYVFADKERVKALNRITHPAIRRIAANRIRKSSNDLVVLDAPLLIEAKFHRLCDEIWVVYTEEEKQLKRLKKRDDISDDLARSIIASQSSFARKRKYADVIIDNSGTMDNTRKQIRMSLKMSEKKKW